MAHVGAVVRSVDHLGRVTLPAEMRRVVGADAGAPLEFFVDGDCVVLRPYRPGCIFCGRVDEGSKAILGKPVCPSCLAEVRTLSGRS